MLRKQNGKTTQSFNEFSRFLEARARKQGIPIHGQFELTPLCNLNCGMCYVHLTKEQMQVPTLGAEQWKELMRQAYENGMYQACLTGGECLIYPAFDELYLYLQGLGCQVDVLTNGTLLNEDRLRFFKAHPPAVIQITLYGWNDDVYERVTGRRVFRTVLENIRRIKEAGLPLILTITPNRALGEDVFETVRLAESITQNTLINTSLFVPPDQPWRGEAIGEPEAAYIAEILRFRQELRGIPLTERPEAELPRPGGPSRVCEAHGLLCGGGRSGFVINWKGEMKICNRLEPASAPLREGFSEAWRRIHQAAENWPRPAECQNCAYEEACGRCAAEVQKYAAAGGRPKALCERTVYMVSRGVLPPPCCE